jgi:hypothetical protein
VLVVAGLLLLPLLLRFAVSGRAAAALLLLAVGPSE